MAYFPSLGDSQTLLDATQHPAASTLSTYIVIPGRVILGSSLPTTGTATTFDFASGAYASFDVPGGFIVTEAFWYCPTGLTSPSFNNWAGTVSIGTNASGGAYDNIVPSQSIGGSTADVGFCARKFRQLTVAATSASASSGYTTTPGLNTNIFPRVKFVWSTGTAGTASLQFFLGGFITGMR